MFLLRQRDADVRFAGVQLRLDSLDEPRGLELVNLAHARPLTDGFQRNVVITIRDNKSRMISPARREDQAADRESPHSRQEFTQFRRGGRTRGNDIQDVSSGAFTAAASMTRAHRAARSGRLRSNVGPPT